MGYGSVAVRFSWGLRSAVWLAALVAAAGAAGVIARTATSVSGTPAASSDEHGRLAAAYGRLPLAFVPNRGQFDARVRFVARGAGYTLALTDQAAFVRLGPRKGAALSVELAGANPHPVLSGESALGGRVNYLIGSDRARWHRNLPTYGRVRYAGVWPGIDVAFYGNQGRLEYDFDVAAGADPGRIALSLQGARKVRVDRSGSLVVGLPGGRVQWLAPRAYQVVAGARRAVASRYVVSGRTVRLRLGRFDRRLPVVIDPTLAYSTYLGGTASEEGRAVAIDSAGAAYLTGDTNSNDFPTTAGAIQPHNFFPGSYDAFVTKLAPRGTALEYSTYLGGFGSDIGYGIAVDSHGAAYITGETNSALLRFPVTPGAYQQDNAGGNDAFVAKLSPSGASLDYSTYLGGSADDGSQAIAVDAAGAAYITGFTASSGPGHFPTTAGAFQPGNAGMVDAFVTKLAPSGASLEYSTYLGGTKNEFGYGLALDSTGAAYVTGETSSSGADPSPFPTKAAIQSTNAGGRDAFVTKVAPSGTSLDYSTYLGGSADDYGYSVAVDSTGAAYIAGRTASTDAGPFPVTGDAVQPHNAGGQDAFVTKVAPGGASLAYSTYLGGTGDDYANGIALDSEHAAYITGQTTSHDAGAFPTTADAFKRTNAGSTDAFLTKVVPGGASLAYSTYLGGSIDDFGKAVAVSSSGAAYITGYTGSGGAISFPTTRGAFQTTYAGANDAFVAKFTGRPSAITEAADHVTTSSAMLRGIVNPQGESTTYHFQYGTSTSYGRRVPATDVAAGAGETDRAVSYPVSRLALRTTYHYRLVATNSSGTSYGEDRTFITHALPPTNTSPPKITGRSAVGQRLSASSGKWSGSRPLTFTYRWQRCKPVCKNIAGATKRFYTPVKADIGARLRVVVTATNRARSTRASSRQTSPVAPATRDVKALLRKLLTPKGQAARIGSLRRNGGYALRFKTLSGGRITIDWYYVPKGANVNKPRRNPKPVLVATGKVSFSKARTIKLKIKLTPAGKRMLKAAKRLKLTAKGAYTPTGGRGVTVRTTFTLKR